MKPWLHVVSFIAIVFSFGLNGAIAQDSTTAVFRSMSWGNNVQFNNGHWVIHWFQSKAFSKATDCEYVYNCAGCNLNEVCLGNVAIEDPENICHTYQGPNAFGYVVNSCDYYTQVYLCISTIRREWFRRMDQCDCPNVPAGGTSGYDEETNTYTEYVASAPVAGSTSLITITPVSSPDTNNAWLPSYGEQLCYRIQVSDPVGPLEAFFRTSTYEGIAMNASIPGSETQQIKDFKTTQLIGWQLSDSTFSGDTAFVYHFISTGEVLRTTPLYFYFRVLDYGAEGDLFVRACRDTSVQSDTLHIPHNYLARFHSRSDSIDGDGLTVWEENRGFVNADGSHRRTSPQTKQILVIDSAGAFQDLDIGQDFKPLLDSMVGAEIVVCNPLTFDTTWQGWTFRRVDFKQGSYGQGGLNAWNTSLTLPAPPYFIDWGNYGEAASQQVAIYIDQAGDTAREWGHCNQQDGFGISGNAGMAVLLQAILEKVEYWQQNNNLPFGYSGQVRTIFKRKVLAHEFGHAIDINDHCPVNDPDCDQFGGSILCPLQNPFNHPPNTSTGWEDWVDNYDNFESWGFINDGTYNCQSQKLYRP